MPTSNASPCVAPLAEDYPSASRSLTSGVPGRDEPVAQAPAMLRAFADARVYAPAHTPVVLAGETGTGKTFLARFIQRVGPRRELPFVSRTAAEISSSLGPAQCFGYERGAFTGAYARSQGIFAEAGCGTLFLDDLHLMTEEVQALLLRALDTGLYRPLGASRDVAARCRIIVGVGESASGPEGTGRILPDLLYRLGRCRITLLPLVERQEEIGPFAKYFLRQCPGRTGVSGPGRFADDVLAMLTQAPWPGNLRELEGAVQRAYLHARGEPEVRRVHFDEDAVRPAPGPAFQRHGDKGLNREAVRAALASAGGCHVTAAARLGVHRNTVRRYAEAGGKELAAK